MLLVLGLLVLLKWPRWWLLACLIPAFAIGQGIAAYVMSDYLVSRGYQQSSLDRYLPSALVNSAVVGVLGTIIVSVRKWAATGFKILRLPWKHPQWTKATLFVALSGFAGTVLGYFLFAIGAGASGAPNYWQWLDMHGLDTIFPWYRSYHFQAKALTSTWMFWAVLGICIAAAIRYLRKAPQAPAT